MKIKCEYCGSFIDDTEEKCPNCGGVNTHFKRNANEAPHTIEELRDWYVAHNLPPENVTRFFIGTNYTAPKAFGIYKDELTGNFVVYKNKADGSRAIRYQGNDEAYAVNELYLKLKEEIINQKQNNLNVSHKINRKNTKKAKNTLTGVIIYFIIIIFIIGIIFSATASRPSRGYYYYGNSYYYYQSGRWYEYSNSRGWYKTTVPSNLKDNYDDYYSSSYYSYDYDIDDFKDSGYYEESTSSSSSSDSSWDSSSSWDSDSSWDSSSTDWSSDW